jgi:hypothetical protein
VHWPCQGSSKIRRLIVPALSNATGIRRPGRVCPLTIGNSSRRSRTFCGTSLRRTSLLAIASASSSSALALSVSSSVSAGPSSVAKFS